MNFVKSETLVQEITSDGKVRDIVTEIQKSDRQKEQEAKEAHVRSLPEFQRDRWGGSQQQSLHGQIQENKDKAEQEKPKDQKVHTIDEDEYEHYQKLEEAENVKNRRRMNEDSAAVE